MFSLFRKYLLLEKAWPFIWTNTEGCFVPSVVEIGPVVLQKKVKMWKVYRRTERRTEKMDGQTEDGQLAIRKAYLRFQLKLAKNGSNLSIPDKTLILKLNIPNHI